MLVLSRKQGERIHIGDDVVVIITKCSRGRVTIGIEAPKERRVIRSEIIDSTALVSGRPAQSVDHCVAANLV